MRTNGEIKDDLHGVSPSIFPQERLQEIIALAQEGEGQTMEEFLGPAEMARMERKVDREPKRYRSGPHRSS